MLCSRCERSLSTLSYVFAGLRHNVDSIKSKAVFFKPPAYGGYRAFVNVRGSVRAVHHLDLTEQEYGNSNIRDTL